VSESAFRNSLAAAIETLPERENWVLSLYYQESLNLREIGAVLDVSESRVQPDSQPGCLALTQPGWPTGKTDHT